MRETVFLNSLEGLDKLSAVKSSRKRQASTSSLQGWRNRLRWSAIARHTRNPRLEGMT